MRENLLDPFPWRRLPRAGRPERCATWVALRRRPDPGGVRARQHRQSRADMWRYMLRAEVDRVRAGRLGIPRKGWHSEVVKALTAQTTRARATYVVRMLALALEVWRVGQLAGAATRTAADLSAALARARALLDLTTTAHPTRGPGRLAGAGLRCGVT